MSRGHEYDGRGSGRWDWPLWEDLSFPAQGINPPGAAADPGVDDDTGLLVFSGTQDNIIVGAAQMPHAWRIGTPVRPHLHLRFPTADAGKNTRWLFEFDVALPDYEFGEAYGTLYTLTTITVANPNNAKKHVVASFGDLDMANCIESTIILWKISRLAASDGADDDTNDCVLMEFDIHHQVEKAGTVVEYPT